MSAAAALSTRPAAHAPAGGPRRVILSDPAGRRLDELPLAACGAPSSRLPLHDAAAQVLVAISPNGSDRPSTGDALHVVVGRRACFGYLVDIDTVRWFSHPRLIRADALSSFDDREVRSLLYDLHSGDPDDVSEIIWETSGRISAQWAPALPAGIDPRTSGWLARERDSAAYWSTFVRILTDPVRDEPAQARFGQGRAPLASIARA